MTDTAPPWDFSKARRNQKYKQKDGVATGVSSRVAKSGRTMLSRGVQRNVVVVALANKLARIAWAVLRKGQPYERAYGIAAI